MKKLYTFSAVMFWVISHNLTAQITFQKIFGGSGDEQGTSIQQTTDGGYIIGGTTATFGGGAEDFYLVKTDTVGDTLWTRTYGEAGSEVGGHVEQISDGGYIIAGSSNSFPTVGMYLVKTNTAGDTLWTKVYGNGATGNGVQQTLDSGFILIGETASFGAGQLDVYLVKTDMNGDTLWSRTFGGTTADWGYSVKQTADKGYILAGETNSFGAGSSDVYLVKTDSNGLLLWSKTYGGTGYDRAYNVQLTVDGGYIIAGTSNSFGGSYDFYLIKTNSAGDALWTKTIGDNAEDIAHFVKQTSDSGFIIAGESSSFGNPGFSDVYLVKTDGTGNVLWSKIYNGYNNDGAFAVCQTTDGGYAIAGITQPFVGGTFDIYLIKTDTGGHSCSETNVSSQVSVPVTQVGNANTITSFANPAVTVPATRVSSGGNVTSLCFSTGIPSEASDNQANVLVYPNPANDIFMIALNAELKNCGLEMYNMLGEKIYSQTINSGKAIVNSKNFSPGIYFVSVVNNGIYYRTKMVIE